MQLPHATRAPRSVGTLLLALLPACSMPEPQLLDGSSTTTAPEPEQEDELADCVALGAEVRGILDANCSVCHGTSGAKGGLSNITDTSRLITTGKIVRGDAAASPIYRRTESGEMPLNGTPLSADQLETLAGWIDTCTADEGPPSPLEAPACVGQPPVATGDVHDRILRDLVDVNPDRQRTTRYMSLVHLHNAGYCDDQIDAYRFAFVKLLNGLSQGPRIVVPPTIDPERTIFRIDLLELGWDIDTWRGIVDRDPYAIVYTDSISASIRNITGADVFVQQADWFIDAASRPPLYEQILELPPTLAELEASLGVDREANIQREREFDTQEVLRACFRDSGVSENNRCIERHDVGGTDNRKYWISYDFADNDPALLHNVFLAPLDFVPNGGEVIFNLPNGLQAYMIVDAEGNQIPEAPEAIVRDHENGGETVINGISCMGCHNEGMRLHADQVREAVLGNIEFDAVTQEQVRRLYTPEPEFTDAQRDDIARFAGSLQQTGSPLEIAGMEPTIAVHNAFEQDLDLDRAAAEFGVPRDQLLKKLSALVGLQVLDVSTVDRQTFQANFPENACLLKLGLTPRCPDDLGGDGESGTGGDDGGASSSEPLTTSI